MSLALRTLVIALFLILSAWAAAALFAQALPAPAGEVILTVGGDVTIANAGSEVAFDFDMLAALPRTVIETSTPWTEGKVAFTGVRLADLLDLLGVREGVLEATALNQYRVEIPVSNAAEGDPIIAYLRDGSPMSVRDRGPLWLIYPYATAQALNHEVYNNRSIWQLHRIDVRKP